ncbi:MAG: PTS cellobiose transporter subunit IIC [Olegusella sp.]|nr:PTS cellobiose transporter subunit IIC [Olegusella sp.]
MAFKEWAEKHQTIWEFLKFNILSNISTITRFGLVALFSALPFLASMTQPFDFFVWHYPTSAGGLGAFYVFLLAEIPAQIVNYLVQMKLTFKSTVSHASAAPRFALLAAINITVSTVLPGYVNGILSGVGIGGLLANLISTLINLVVQVIICFYPMKVWVFSGDKTRE